MKKIQFTVAVLLTATVALNAQVYHAVTSYSYSSEGLYAKVIKANPANPKIIYMGAQNVNLNYKGFFDTYDLTQTDTVKRIKRMGIQTDSFGVTDFVFRGSDIYAIGSKGLQIINASTPENPVFSKNIKTINNGTGTMGIGYMTASILIEGNKMHYGGSNYYLIDISNINSCTKIAERSYSGINSGSIVQLSANKVLIGDGYDLKIFDVSAAPTVTSTTLSTLYGDPKQMLYDESKRIIYTTFATSSQNYIYSVNMDNNTKLDSFNYLSVNGFKPSSHSSISLYKDTLYIGTSLGIALFDVSNPSDLRFIGKLTTGGSNAVYVNDDYIVTNDNYNLRFYRRGSAPVTSVYEETTLSTIELFPNPAQKSVSLILNQTTQPQIQMFDNLGRLAKNWMSTSISDKHEIPLSGIKPGIYFMQIQSGTNL